MKNSLNNDNKLFADYCRTIKIGTNKMQCGGGQGGEGGRRQPPEGTAAAEPQA